MEQLLLNRMEAVVSGFADATGLKESTVCKRAVEDARFLEGIRSGKTFTMRRYDKLFGWLLDNWPDNAALPKQLVDWQSEHLGLVSPSELPSAAFISDAAGHAQGEV